MTNQFKESEKGIQAVYGAMKEWMEKTCIVFTPEGSETHKSAGHDNSITIFTGIGCYSRVGYTGDVVVDGDMILTPRQYLASYGVTSGFGGGAIINENHLWPKRITPWKMTNQFKESDKGIQALYGA